MTPVRRIAASLAAALAVTLVPAQAGSAAAGDPDFHKPTVGDCHDYTYDEMYGESDTTPTVPCTDPHTGKVITVVRLPEGRTWANTDTDARLRIVYRKCWPALEAVLGRSAKVRNMTAFSTAWFIPTKAERNAGARWLRCDLILVAGTRLADLPYDTAPMLPAPPMPDAVARCQKAKTFYTTTCATGHAFRATGAFEINKADIPSDKQVRRASLKRCPALVSSRTYRWSWPSSLLWKAGNHVVVCYSKTTH